MARAPAVQKPNATIPQPTRKRLFVLSANDKKSLEARMHSTTVYLEQKPEVFQNSLMPNLAYTLGQRRSILPWKVAVPALGSAELIPSLAGSTITPSRSSKEPSIGFVFTGQGAQWAGMGRELIEAYPIFASTMERIDECLVKLGADFSLISMLLCPDVNSPAN
jgi:acyl transferase domain-containing protein